MPEKQSQELVRRACTLHHWIYYYTHACRHSPSGFVDTVAVRGSRMIAAELKRRGQGPTAAQEQWLEALCQVTQVEVYVWTEDDFPSLLQVFR